MDTTLPTNLYTTDTSVRTSSYATDPSHSPITADASIGAKSAGTPTVIVASVLGVIFVAIMCLSWYWYRRYRFSKDSSNSTEKSRYRNVSKLSSALSSSFSSIFGKTSGRELGLPVKQAKNIRGGSPLGLNTNSGLALNNYGSSSNYSLHDNKINTKMDALNNGQRNVIVSSIVYPNFELTRAAPRETSRNLVDNIIISETARVSANASQASPFDISISPSPVPARAGINGSRGNLIDRRSKSPEARLARAASNVGRIPKDGNSPSLGGSDQDVFGDSNCYLKNQDNSRDNHPGGIIDLLQSGGTEMDECEQSLANRLMSKKVLPNVSAANNPISPAQIEGRRRFASQKNVGGPLK